MAATTLAPYDKDHEDPNGPGDARPTALKVIRDQELDGKLQGKVFLVTGCTSGIGLETARALHVTGADVFITGRDTERGRQVVERLTHDGKPGKVVFIEMHLDSLASVRATASKFLQMSDKLNGLICNAGLALHPKARTKDGFEMHFGANHPGHFALFEALKDTILKSATPECPSRLVMVGDAVHPTSVHLGQGANQACEDCYYLTKEIPDFDPTKELPTSMLTEAFKAYATKQQPHTSILVKGARALGMARVAAPELCSQRDQAITQGMADREGLQAKFDFTYSRPF